MKVYLVAYTRKSDGFFYANENNRMFMNKNYADEYCKKLTDEQYEKELEKYNERLEEYWREQDIIDSILSQLSNDEVAFLKYNFLVTVYPPIKPEPEDVGPYTYRAIEFELN